MAGCAAAAAWQPRGLVPIRTKLNLLLSAQLQTAEKESERDRGGAGEKSSGSGTHKRKRKPSGTEIMRALGGVEMLWNSTHLVKGSNEAIGPGRSRSLG